MSEKHKYHSPQTDFDHLLSDQQRKINKEKRYVRNNGLALAVAIIAGLASAAIGAGVAGNALIGLAFINAGPGVVRLLDKYNISKDLQLNLGINKKIDQIISGVDKVRPDQKRQIMLAVRSIHFTAASYDFSPFDFARNILLPKKRLSKQEARIIDSAKDSMKDNCVDDDSLLRALEIYQTLMSTLPDRKYDYFDERSAPTDLQLSEVLYQRLSLLIPETDDNMLPSRLAVEASGTTTIDALMRSAGNAWTDESSSS